MINFNKQERLEKHIKALINAYDNQIELLEKDITKKKKSDDSGEEEEIKISDGQIKVYSEGISKLSETSDKLFSEINNKITVLEGLKKDGDAPEKNKPSATNKKSSMNEHLG